jgi:hypothetical protein
VGKIPETDNPAADVDWIDAAISSFCRWRNVDQQFTSFWSTKNVPEEK